MSLLTASQMASIRSLGEKGMTVDVTITRVGGFALDDGNPFGDDTLTTTTTSSITVKGWMVTELGRTFDEDSGRVVSVHDFTLRIPVGTQVDHRDTVTIGGADYTVVETNEEDTWPEWKVCYLKRIS